MIRERIMLASVSVMLLSLSLAVMPVEIEAEADITSVPGLDRAVETMLARASFITGSSPYPIDGTRILSDALSGRISYMGFNDANPPPSNWNLQYSGTYCDIYVAQGETVPSSKLESLADVFDVRIYPNVTEWFHPDSPPSKIDFKLYDFGDGVGGVAGFFIRSIATRDELYVDTEDIDYSHEIVAHEFQHLLHYDLDFNEDTWLDEGMADLAIRVSLGPGTPALQSHIDALEMYPENDLIRWDEGAPPDYIETIADYGRAYSMIAYLADHYGGSDFISDLAADPRNGISSIDSVLSDWAFSDTLFDIHLKERMADVVDDPIFGGGIFDQGLMDIEITTRNGSTGSYPFEHAEYSTKRYGLYTYRFTDGSSGLAFKLNSTASVSATLVGTSGGESVWSANMTSSNGISEMEQLSGFGTEYDVLYAAVSTPVKDEWFEVSVENVVVEPPVTDITILPADPDGNNGYYVTPPSIVLTTRAESRVYYRFDEGDFEEVAGTITPPEGIHDLEFYALDPLGPKEATRSVRIMLDTIAPFTEINVVPDEPDGNGGYYVTQPKVSLQSLDGEKIYYDIGAGPVEYDETLSLPEGIYDLNYWSEDLAGNVEDVKSREFKVVLTTPEAGIEVTPEEPNGDNGYYTEEVSVSLFCDHGEASFYSLNKGPFMEYDETIILGDGIWDIEYYGLGPSGYRSSSKYYTVRVDTTIPSIGYRTEPPLSEGWQSEATYLYLETDDPDAMISYTLDGSDPYEYTQPALLNDGEYIVTYQVKDRAGNVRSGDPIRVRIDGTAPRTVLTFDREPDYDLWFYGGIPSLTFESRSNVISKETIYYSLEEGDFQVFSGQDIDLVPGVNTIRYYGVDQAGNTEIARTTVIGIDFSTPVAAVSANRTFTDGPGPILFYLDESRDDNAIQAYRVFFGDGTDSGWILSPQVSHNYTAYGSYTVRVQVRDVSGRVSEEEAQIEVEILTHDEYLERIREDNTPWVILTVVVLVLLLSAVAVLVVMIIRRNRTVEVIIQDDEDAEDWDA
ncbi:MAG: Ig-like domain-containing protein [Thermoplasmatota archaeon]